MDEEHTVDQPIIEPTMTAPMWRSPTTAEAWTEQTPNAPAEAPSAHDAALVPPWLTPPASTLAERATGPAATWSQWSGPSALPPYVTAAPPVPRRLRPAAVIAVFAAVVLVAMGAAALVGVRTSKHRDSTSPIVSAPDTESGGRSQPAKVVALVPLADTAGRTAAAKTARTRFVITVPSIPGLKGSVTMTGEGVVDFEHKNQSMTMNMAELFAKLAADERPTNVQEATMELRVVDGIMYMRLPMLRQLDPSLAGKWLKIDLAAAARSAGMDPTALTGSGVGQDPASYLSILGGADQTDVQNVATETVDGVETVHYHANIDMLAAMDRVTASPLDRKKLGKLVEQLGLKQMPVDAWADSDGRVRKVQMITAVNGQQATMELGFSDFGVAVDVSAPPAAEVIDAMKMAGIATNGAGGAANPTPTTVG